MKRFRPLTTLFAVALLLVGVLGVYRLGWREGYGQGAQGASQAQPSPDEAPAPYAPWGRPVYRGYWLARGGHLGWLLSLGLILLLGALFVKTLFLKTLRFAGWHMHKARHGGPNPKGGPHPPWQHGAHAPWGHGPWGNGPWHRGPWCDCVPKEPDDQDRATDEQVAKVQPEPQAD